MRRKQLAAKTGVKMDNKLQATIDIGSHSCILLIAAFEDAPASANPAEAEVKPAEAEVKPRQILVPKLQKVEVCRLGEDIYEHGAISQARINELSAILTKFRMDHGSEIVTIDIGGGSTELSNGETTFSIPVGALKMFKAMGPIPGPEYKKFVKETFKEVSFKGMTKKQVYLIGGTGTALAMVYLDKPKFDYKAIEGLELSINDLDAVTTRISNLSKELRAMLPGLENGRSDIIICGLFWLKSLLEKLRVESFKISTAGLRFGLLYPPEPEPEVKPKAKKTPPWLKKKTEENSVVEGAESAAD